MSRHYFPSVLDDFEKQTISSENSIQPVSVSAAVVTSAAQELDPK